MTPAVRRVLVLGGARSGKSAFAARRAAELGEPVLVVATAEALDAEMADRIRRHREARPSHWRILEEPRRVAEATALALGDTRTVLFEDLTLLLSNVLTGDEQGGAEAADDVDALAAEQAVTAELDGLLRLPAHLVLVSNEVGLGLVPPTFLGRAFRDALGRVNQYAAARADEVHLLVAGVPVRLR